MSSVCNEAQDARPASNSNAIVSMYLSKHIPEYRELIELRKQVRAHSVIIAAALTLIS
jgi:hypothetical protein